MSNEWNSQILAQELLDIIPKLSKLMVTHTMSLAENEATLRQMGALYILMDANMTTSDLAKKRHVSLQAASTFVQGLVDRNWVIRVDDPQDRRRSILKVTAEGRKQEEALRKKMTGHLANLVSKLNQDEIVAAQVFLNGLSQIVQNHNPKDINLENDN